MHGFGLDAEGVGDGIDGVGQEIAGVVELDAGGWAVVGDFEQFGVVPVLAGPVGELVGCRGGVEIDPVIDPPFGFANVAELIESSQDDVVVHHPEGAGVRVHEVAVEGPLFIRLGLKEVGGAAGWWDEVEALRGEFRVGRGVERDLPPGGRGEGAEVDARTRGDELNDLVLQRSQGVELLGRRHAVVAVGQCADLHAHQDGTLRIRRFIQQRKIERDGGRHAADAAVVTVPILFAAWHGAPLRDAAVCGRPDSPGGRWDELTRGAAWRGGRGGEVGVRADLWAVLVTRDSCAGTARDEPPSRSVIQPRRIPVEPIRFRRTNATPRRTEG